MATALVMAYELLKWHIYTLLHQLITATY